MKLWSGRSEKGHRNNQSINTSLQTLVSVYNGPPSLRGCPQLPLYSSLSGEGQKELSGRCQVRNSLPRMPCLIRRATDGTSALNWLCGQRRWEAHSKLKTWALYFLPSFCLYSLNTCTFYQELCLPPAMECIPSTHWNKEMNSVPG